MKNFKLLYSKEFMNDFVGVVEYIKKDSVNAAKIFERNIRKKIGLLQQFPEMGRAADEPRLQGVRILIVGNYLILYEVNPEKNLIYLHGFCHGARDYPNLFRKFN